METIIALALSWALQFVEYPEPAELPKYQYVTKEWIQEKYCPTAKKCNAYALYDDKGVLYLRENVDWENNTIAFAMLSHEVTHYLQHLAGQNLDCENITKREREGYHVQQSVIAAYGLHYPVGVFPTLTCET